VAYIKPKRVGLFHNLDNTAEVDRPKASGMSLDRHQLSGDDPRKQILDSHPSQVELLPSLNGFTRGREGMFSSANLTAGKIMRKTP
jgi:hypothetical protein